MKKFRIKVNNKEHHVTLLRRERNFVSFLVNNKSYDLVIQAEASEQRSQKSSATSPTPLAQTVKVSKSGLIVSPMPGIVSTICVAVGAEVKAGDTVIVIEAMKMENNVVALSAGKVKEIQVVVGEEVNHGQGLVLVS